MMRARYLLVAVCALVIACLPCAAEKVFPDPTVGEVVAEVVHIGVGISVGAILPAAAVPATIGGYVADRFVVQPGVNIFVEEIQSIQWRKAGPLTLPIPSYTSPYRRFTTIFDRLKKIRDRLRFGR